MIGTTFDGKYKVTRHLGSGAMGTVYEAVDVATGQRVALKLITAEVAKNQILLQRFQREAKACSGVETPHILKVLDAEREDASGLPYMVMELLDGEDLESLVARLGPLPPDLVLRIAAQVCAGLDEAHKAGIVHRDIKPANLFLARQNDGGDGRIIKIVDFGLAKIRMEHLAGSGDRAVLTRTGMMLGSPLYMAPEQARGAKTIDARADLWSLGIVLYEALTGRTPYDKCETLSGLTAAICTQPPAPLQATAPWVPPAIAAVVHNALRLDPAERYASAAAMLRAIHMLLPEGASITEPQIRPLSSAERAAKAPELILSMDTAARFSPELSEARGSGLTCIVITAVLAALAITALLYIVLF